MNAPNTPRKLPAELLDQVLRRLVATYGRRFWQQYEGADASDVRAIWSRELAGFEQRPDVFAWAFENLPEDPPNAIAFRNLCRRMPAPPTPILPAPPADPERVRAELAKLQHIARPTAAGNLAWARNAIEKAQRGEYVSPATLRAARSVAHRLNVADPAET